MSTQKASHIRVVVIEPGRQPEVRTIENSLPAMRAIVGGSIEIFQIEVQNTASDGEEECGTSRFEGVCNDEFLGSGLPMNRAIPEAHTVICGNFFVAAPQSGPDGVEFRSLLDAEAAAICHRFDLCRDETPQFLRKLLAA